MIRSARTPIVGIETLAFMEGKEPPTPLPDNAHIRFAVNGGWIVCYLKEGHLCLHGESDTRNESLAIYPRAGNSALVEMGTTRERSE